jgi:nicotinic acid mononucleotide adenylyltransferase
LHRQIGADQLADIEWLCRIDELLKECRVRVMVRAGYPLPNFNRFAGIFLEGIVEQLKNDSIQTPLIDLSSTDIRYQCAAGTLPPGTLPAGVLQYIKQYHLYGGTWE